MNAAQKVRKALGEEQPIADRKEPEPTIKASDLKRRTTPKPRVKRKDRKDSKLFMRLVFDDHPEILEKIEQRAKAEVRTVSNWILCQLIKMVKEDTK